MDDNTETILYIIEWCVLFLFLVNATLLMSYYSRFWSVVLGIISFLWLVLTAGVFWVVNQLSGKDYPKNIRVMFYDK